RPAAPATSDLATAASPAAATLVSPRVVTPLPPPAATITAGLDEREAHAAMPQGPGMAKRIMVVNLGFRRPPTWKILDRPQRTDPYPAGGCRPSLVGRRARGDTFSPDRKSEMSVSSKCSKSTSWRSKPAGQQGAPRARGDGPVQLGYAGTVHRKDGVRRARIGLDWVRRCRDDRS